jgi:hypothetical protein
MGSLQERIAAYADASANLLALLTELDELRERVRKAQLSTIVTPKRGPSSCSRRALVYRAGLISTPASINR